MEFMYGSYDLVGFQSIRRVAIEQPWEYEYAWSGDSRVSSMSVVEKKKLEQKQMREKSIGNSHRKNRSGGKDNCPICQEKQRRPLAGYIQKQNSNDSSILEEEEEVKEIPSCQRVNK